MSSNNVGNYSRVNRDSVVNNLLVTDNLTVESVATDSVTAGAVVDSSAGVPTINTGTLADASDLSGAVLVPASTTSTVTFSAALTTLPIVIFSPRVARPANDYSVTASLTGFTVVNNEADALDATYLVIQK